MVKIFGAADGVVPKGHSTGRRRHSRRVLGAWLVVGAVGLVGLTGCGGRDFVPYAPTADLLPLEDGSTVFAGSYAIDGLLGSCKLVEMVGARNPGPNESEWRTLSQALDGPERYRQVSIATQRLVTRQALDDQLTQIRQWLKDPCSSDEGTVEPASLSGLPDGAVTARWRGGPDDSWMTVVGDRDRQIMMIVQWTEPADPVPTDAFVDVVNTAWTDFVSENSP